jgi:hypothetical protein
MINNSTNVNKTNNIFAFTQKDQILSMNDNINMNSTIAGSMNAQLVNVVTES